MKWIFGVILAWLVFVMSLAGWWLYFGMTTLSGVSGPKVPDTLARHQRMLFLEGSVLLVSLLVGGLALFYFSYHMYKEKSAKEIFFASFAHDLKTALFRLQLEVEKLGKVKEVGPLLNHTRKMQLDLENSLDSALGAKKKLFIEKINLKNFLLDLHAQWPELSFKLTGEDELPVDRNALHSIFKNLLHNSYFHGEADEVWVQLSKSGSRYRIQYTDNGKAFDGEHEYLGQSPSYSLEGSGFGLFIVRQWVRKMGGQIQFLKSSKSALEVTIELPGRLS